MTRQESVTEVSKKFKTPNKDEISKALIAHFREHVIPNMGGANVPEYPTASQVFSAPLTDGLRI